MSSILPDDVPAGQMPSIGGVSPSSWFSVLIVAVGGVWRFTCCWFGVTATAVMVHVFQMLQKSVHILALWKQAKRFECATSLQGIGRLCMVCFVEGVALPIF